jgi:glycosyltransferase involved in cell wall biosynthesis
MHYSAVAFLKKNRIPLMFDISIEITTYNRKEVLRDLLERLDTQTFPRSRFEVVLSDDGSTDGLQEMVREIAPNLTYKLRLLQNTHEGPGHAHNVGIRACQADIVLMLAADILPTPTAVEEHVRSHRAYPDQRVVVAGKLTQSPSLPDTIFQRAVNVQVERVLKNQFNEVEHGGFMVSNLSFKKDFMLEFGMFLEWPPASGEDIELGYRLKKAGMTLIKNDQAMGFHHHQETLATVAKRAYLTGYNSHFFTAYVDEPWVRRRFGIQELNKWSYALQMRNCLRNLLINHITAECFMIPLIRLAETLKFLEALTPFLIKRVTSYYFKRGIAEFKKGLPLVFPEVMP